MRDAMPRPHRASTLLPFAVVLAAAALLAVPAGAASRLACRDLPELLDTYVRKHVSARGVEAELRTRTAERFMNRLDPQKTLLLADEEKALRNELLAAFDVMREGDCAAFGSLHTRLLERHQATEHYVRALVRDEGFELDRDSKLVMDPDERKVPVNEVERLRRVRAMVHFQISNYLASDQTLEEARERVEHRYHLATRRWAEKTRTDLYADFVDAFAGGLDPHSGYLSADDLEDFQIGMQLSLEGIGVALAERDGYAVVEQIIPGGAADALDVLKPKDKIIAVAEADGEPVDVIDMALRDVVRLIRGKKGTTVNLTVLRQEEDTERFRVAIVRDKIDLEEQAAKLRFEEVPAGERTLKLAVLDLPSFYGDRDPTQRQASRDVARILKKITEEGADGLLLDLSRNGGGLLEDAVKISGFFIRKGGVVAIQDSAQRTRVLRDPDDGLLYKGPMVVLTSRISASASEILAGALKDYDRAVIVGDDHTFGKGTVQSVIPLRPGLGAMRVTTALFFRPGGTSTQNEGVETDVQIPSFFAREDFGESAQPYALPSSTIGPFRDRRANYEEAQRRWRPLSSDVRAELVRRSQQRVAANEAFEEIVRELAERNEDDGVIVLSELMDEREKSTVAQNDSNGSAPLGAQGSDARPTASATGAGAGAEGEVASNPDGPGRDDDEPTPQLEEALRILADLVQLTS